jgi:fermentation-respiration switch protein FrsA (DUF1100 family)
MKKLLLFTFTVISSLIIQAQEVSITFPSDQFNLEGTLSTPSGNGPFPVMIFVHGSGPNDRDQTLHLTGGNSQCLYPGIYNDTVRNFKDLANSFMQKGMAVLRYDKRSFTFPSQLDPKQVSPYDFITDIHSAIDYIKTRPEIDTNCITLLGHSQGANFTPIVTAQRTDVSNIISLGAGARGIDTLIALQYRDLYYICLNDTITGNTLYNQTLLDFQKIRNGTWDANTPYQGAYPKFWKEWMNITDSAVINYNAVSKPVLFLQAMDDFNIPLADAQRYESQITTGNSSVYYLTGLNHFFTTATNASVAPVVTDTIFNWLGQHPCEPNSVASVTEHNNTLIISYTHSVIRIKNELNMPISRLQIIDSQGKLVYHNRYNSAINLEVPKNKFKPGIYVISGVLNGKAITQKILIR